MRLSALELNRSSVKIKIVNQGHRYKMNFSISALYDWYRNAIRNPKYRWWIMIGTAIYLISPIDIAPDFIPIIGQIDDVMLAGLLFTELSQMVMTKLQSRKDNVDVASQTPGKETVDVDVVETVSTN